jgi:hypothetical protein
MRILQVGYKFELEAIFLMLEKTVTSTALSSSAKERVEILRSQFLPELSAPYYSQFEFQIQTKSNARCSMS